MSKIKTTSPFASCLRTAFKMRHWNSKSREAVFTIFSSRLSEKGPVRAGEHREKCWADYPRGCWSRAGDSLGLIAPVAPRLTAPEAILHLLVHTALIAHYL